MKGYHTVFATIQYKIEHEERKMERFYIDESSCHSIFSYLCNCYKFALDRLNSLNSLNFSNKHKHKPI